VTGETRLTQAARSLAPLAGTGGLGVSARMLQKRGNNLFDACDFKGLGMGRCGQKMAFSNFRAMNLSIVVRAAT
jgi:hypothetical protein